MTGQEFLERVSRPIKAPLNPVESLIVLSATRGLGYPDHVDKSLRAEAREVIKNYFGKIKEARVEYFRLERPAAERHAHETKERLDRLQTFFEGALHDSAPVSGTMWRHYKGDLYEVIHVATHSENASHRQVAYRRQGSEGSDGVWHRPLSMWNEVVHIAPGVNTRRFAPYFEEPVV